MIAEEGPAPVVRPLPPGDPLSAPEARRLAIRVIASDIVADRVSPLDGAVRIVDLIDHEVSGPNPTDVIQWLLYQDQETPEDRPPIEHQIRLAAADLLRG